MKGYVKLWLVSFVMSFCALALSIAAFLFFIKQNSVDITPEPAAEQQPVVQTETVYVEPQDNVGAVSFTEDQMTELARKLFSLDGFLKDLTLEFEEGEIVFTAKIKDKDKLIEVYPELKKFSAVLSLVENKKISAVAVIENIGGRAALTLDSVTVGGMPIDADAVSPFIEMDGLSELFDVEYRNIELTDGSVIFKNGVPKILEY